MWLLEGSNAPDHSTIARFIKFYLCEAMEDLYYQLIQHLHSIGEITFKNIFIDGTKIEANANKYTFVWKKVVSKNEEKMFKKIQSSIENLNNEFFTNFTVNKESIIEDLQIILDFLKEKKIEKNIEFAHGIGKRKSKIQRFTEEFEEYNARQLKYNESNSLFDGRNSYSKTDKDATFMRMKDDHMRNSQLKPGYNVQIGVDSEYITAVDVYSDRSDVTTLKPFLENIQSNLGEKYENIIADAGYESEENYVYLSENEQNAYIKPLTYEQSKKRKFKKDISKRENMTYDKNTDEYTCHNNKKLKPTNTTTRTSATGYKSELTVYECEDCSDCAHKSKCTKAKGNKQIQVSKVFVNNRQKSYENITSKVGILLRTNRSIQVEGAFGVLKWDYQFNRFLRRGKNNIKLELLLLCFGYNINKLHSKIQNDRCRTYLHEEKIA